MKKTLAIILALLLPLTASAVYIVDQGGTGSTTLSGLLKGNGKNMVQTATAGTDYVLPSALSSYLTLSSWYATTTDGLDEGLTNLYFTNARAQSALTGYFATTTTSNTWSGAQTFGTLTASTGTIDHLITDELTAKTSAGSTFRSANGTPVSVLGVGNSANVLFYGGVNIDGAVRMATSLNGLALLTNGAVTSIATSSLGLLTTNVAEGSNLYFTNGRVLTYLDTLSKGYFFSTTSADYWLTTKSLTSASSTLLGDINTWSATNQFAKLTFTNATGTNATTTNFSATIGTFGTLIASSSATTSLSFISSTTTKGTCIKMQDASGGTFTYMWSQSGVVYTSATSCL